MEVDGAGEDNTSAGRVMEIANGNGLENLYCKHDGSLDDGFELVTHPMTLEYHMKEMPWDRVLREAICLGYTSHQATTCGLHAHVNMSDDQINAMSLTTFAAGCAQPDLVQYLKERMLYVNEPVESEEEV